MVQCVDRFTDLVEHATSSGQRAAGKTHSRFVDLRAVASRECHRRHRAARVA
jgi:hypothetical protein